MNAYMPHGPGGILGVLLVTTIVFIALLVTRLRSRHAGRAASWALVAVAVMAAHVATTDQPAGFRMIVIIGALLSAMKSVVSIEETARDGTRLPPMRWLAFAALWPGMKPGLFTRMQPGRTGALQLARRGIVRLALGVALIALARLAWRATGSTMLGTLLLLPGLSLVVHFGLFSMLAGAWRVAGADTSALFRAPARAASLGEFWSRRWNVAFSEMTALAVYRRLASTTGQRVALVCGFLFSGLLHEAAISLPVGTGYGGPLLYFAIHGFLAVLERESGPFGRAATLAAVILPLPLLFHRPFLRGVVWPLLGSCA